MNSSGDVEGSTSTSIDAVTTKTDTGGSVNATVDVKGQTETSYMETLGATKNNDGIDIQKHGSYMNTSGAITTDGSYMDTSGAIKTDDGIDIQKHGYAEPAAAGDPAATAGDAPAAVAPEGVANASKTEGPKTNSSIPEEQLPPCANGRKRNKGGDCFKGCPENTKFSNPDGDGNCECKEASKCYDMEAVELAHALAKEFKKPEKAKELLQIVEKDQEGKSPGCKMNLPGAGAASAGSISERLFDHACRSCICKAGASGISVAAPLLVFALVIFGL